MVEFRLDTLRATPLPQTLVWQAAHGDYSEDYIFDEPVHFDEAEAGRRLLKMLFKKHRPHCYDDVTEVLTEKGFKPFSEVVNTAIKVAAIDPNEGDITFEHAQKWISYPYEGKMYQVVGQSVDLVVTPEHRMCVSHRYGNNTWTDWYNVTAKELADKPVRYLKSGVLNSDQESKIANTFGLTEYQFATLLGFALGGGAFLSKNQIVFHLEDLQKVDFLNLIAPDLVDRRSNDEYTFTYTGIGDWFNANCYTEDRQKKLPDGFLTWSYETKLGLLSGLRISDGRNKRNTWTYCTTSSVLADQFSALMAVTGRVADVNYCTWDNPDCKPVYGLTVSQRVDSKVEVNQKGRPSTYGINWIEYKGNVYCCTVSTGNLVVRRNGKVVVSGNCGPFEHPHITFAVGNFPHDTVMQMRTHRVATFDVQSMRYTGKRIIDYINGDRDFDEVFYLPPVGTELTDREGNKSRYTATMRIMDKQAMTKTAEHYKDMVEKRGVPPEQARRVLSSGYRQNFTFTINARTLMHLLDMRGAKDVQDECAVLAAMMLEKFKLWMPEVAYHYEKTRWQKSNLAP